MESGLKTPNMGNTGLMGGSSLAGWVTKGKRWLITYEREQVGDTVSRRLKTAEQTELCACLALFPPRLAVSGDMPRVGLDYRLEVK